MSLYFEASKFLGQSNSSLKTRVFSDKTLKSQPTQVYAVVAEAKKWSPVLKEVIDNAKLLSLEKKLTPELALLLVHDLLFSKKGIAAPASHKLRVAVESHKARLQAELTKARIRRKCVSTEQLKSQLSSLNDSAIANADNDGGDTRYERAKWVRINRLKSTLEEQLSGTFAAYQRVPDIKSILQSYGVASSSRRLYIDEHIPDLIALPPNTDLSRERAYLKGELIIQDKASCFPAYLLDPRPDDGGLVDACAAPGNKTTHLASIIYALNQDTPMDTIIACERDKLRAKILDKMIQVAGADSLTKIKSGQDFLRVKPDSEPWCNVGALLLDPSCSGSGIVGRDEDNEAVILPSIPTTTDAPSKKRKRGKEKEPPQAPPQSEPEIAVEEEAGQSVSKERLQALSAFQAKLVIHAMTFPEARKITYSTCSIHDEENEHVVAAVLGSDVAKNRGWQILGRDQQVEGMKKWHVRGRKSKTLDLDIGDHLAEACIRCDKYTEDGTQGFFVAAFVRTGEPMSDDAYKDSNEDADENGWSGFDD